MDFDDIPNPVFTLSLEPRTQYVAFVGVARMELTPHVQSLSWLCSGYLLQLRQIDVKSEFLWPHSCPLTSPRGQSLPLTYEPAPPGVAVIIGIDFFLFSTPGNISLVV